MTVREAYNINEIKLEEKAESEHPYWVNAFNFYEQVHDRDVEDLSEGQRTWLDKISEQLELEIEK